MERLLLFLNNACLKAEMVDDDRPNVDCSGLELGVTRGNLSGIYLQLEDAGREKYITSLPARWHSCATRAFRLWLATILQKRLGILCMPAMG